MLLSQGQGGAGVPRRAVRRAHLWTTRLEDVGASGEFGEEFGGGGLGAAGGQGVVEDVAGREGGPVQTGDVVSVAGGGAGGDPGVVGLPSAGEADVERLPRSARGEDEVGGVGGEALGAVDGDRVAEVDVLGEVAGGQPDGSGGLAGGGVAAGGGG